ncbi:MAG: tetratricopeptide repeat protein [Bryobacterales bacterium]|nr:tetratricopeptide repeat protein [Bryobacterales bacterium]
MASRGRLLATLLALLGSALAAATPDEEFAAAFRAARDAHIAGDLGTAAVQYERALALRTGIAEIHGNLGLVRYSQGDCQAAMNSFERALELKPGLFVPLAFGGACLTKMRIFEPAEQWLESARDQRPRDAHVLLHLGVAHAGSGREELAARHLRTLLQERPADEEALYQLGRAYLALASEAYGHLDGAGEFYRQKLLADLHAELNRPDAEVAERFRAAIRLDDSYPGMRVGLARALASQGLVDEARRALEEELALSSPGLPALRLLAELSLPSDEGRAARALQAWLDRVPRSDGELASLLAQDQSTGLAWLDSVLTLESEGEPIPGAVRIADLRETLARMRSLIGPRGLGWPLELYVRCRLRQGRTDEALAEMHSLAEAHRGNPAVHYLFGEIYRELSLAAHDRLLDAVPGSFRAHMLRARLEEIQYRPLQAIKSYRAALAVQPAAPDARYRIGVLLARERRLDEAIREFELELRLDPYHAAAKIRLGEILVHQRRADEAVPLLEEAIDAGSPVPEALVALGRCYEQQDRVEDAVNAYERAIHVKPGQRDAHYRLARLYRQLGRAEDADAAFSIFRQLSGQSRAPSGDALDLDPAQ